MRGIRSVKATLDLLPDRRMAEIQNAWVPNSEVEPGSEVPVKVFVQPYRGERIEKEFTVKIPANLPRGPHTILFSDADTLNRMQSGAAMSEHMDIPQTVSLINQERRNDRLYVSLLEAGPTVFYEDNENDIVLGAIAKSETVDYLGYFKKMLLTQHNVIMMRRGFTK